MSDRLQSLIADAGRKAVIPPGEYEVDFPIEIYKGQSITDFSGSVVTPSASFPKNEPIIAIKRGTNRLRIEGLTIEGNNYQCGGIFADDVFRLTLRDIWIRGLNGIGISIGNADDLMIQDCDIRRCGTDDGNGVSLNLYADPPPVPGREPKLPGSNTIRLNNVTIEGYDGIGLHAVNQTVIGIRDCKFHGTNDGKNVSTIGVSLERCDRVRFSDCHSVNATQYDYSFQDCRDIEVSGQISEQGRRPKFRNVNSKNMKVTA